MANANVSNLGQINGSGDTEALFLKVFAGEVLTAFAEACVTADKHMVRNIEHGKSAQFPVIGKTVAEYHVPGTEILGDQIPANEMVINIDGNLIAAAFIANIDEAMNHYDVRGPYSDQIGKALAYTYDQHVLQVALAAARLTTGAVETEAGGGSVTNASLLSDTSGEAFIASMFNAATILDNNYIPEDDRWCFLTPAVYNMLAQNTKIMNRFWGGEGEYAGAKVLRVAGINVVKAVHTPFGQNITGTGARAGATGQYAINATNTAGLVMHKAAVGTVKLRDLAMESEYDIRRQGTLMVAKYAMGHGALRPAACVELKTA